MFVYILASKTGHLYVGVTNDLVRRAWEHWTGAVPGFTRRYGIHRLVYFETIVEAAVAIAREKQIKDYTRVKKIAMINSVILSGTTWPSSGLLTPRGTIPRYARDDIASTIPLTALPPYPSTPRASR